jgi:hypothetical protein
LILRLRATNDVMDSVPASAVPADTTVDVPGWVSDVVM